MTKKCRGLSLENIFGGRIPVNLMEPVGTERMSHREPVDPGVQIEYHNM